MREARLRGAQGVIAGVLTAFVAWSAAHAQTKAGDDPTPQTLEEFKVAATRVLQDTKVSGAGIALVRQDGVEWTGGLGFADRDAHTPVTADTHFRVGSISKTFVALALVQLYENDKLDIEAPLRELAPDIVVDNPWDATDPVRLIHVLQHTAGFDDMHFNELYVADAAPELSLTEVLRRNPGSRRVRWRPGTRTSYSNPGYGVAAYVLEKVAGEPYEDYIKREIFDKLEMSTSSFRLTAADEGLLARGYNDESGPPTGFPRIYLRPAGNMHSSPREMAQFVRMLLGWGELGTSFVVDPEYLGNMEQPRTTLAAAAGLRNGYGSGIYATLNLPYHVLGHNGGIVGFASSYGYSPGRDVGYVVLINSTGPRANETVHRLSSLAIRYLKRDIDPPAKPAIAVDRATLDQYTGYYLEANPRNELVWAIESLVSGVTVSRDGDALFVRRIRGAPKRLVPVTDRSFRNDDELDASVVFTQDAAGTMVMAGPTVYAEKLPRWRMEILRVPVLACVPAVLSVFAIALIWIARAGRARPHGFWSLKLALLACPALLIIPAAVLMTTKPQELGRFDLRSVAVFAASIAVPLAVVVVTILTVAARRAGASRLLTGYAFAVALAMAGLSAYLGVHGLVGLRLWSY